ncbi:MAG: hypothetical protein FWF03_08300, partial [Defluviitaleaceae bacterium]|nr:hypothetical protein [Defluviitaleaceae bacterium]
MLDRGIFGRFGEEEETRRHGLNANPSPGFDLDDDDEAEEKLLDEEYSDPIYDINYDDLDSLYYEEILYPPHEFECGAEEENDLDMPRDFECDEDAQPDLEDFKEPLGFDGYGHESPDLENFKDPLGFDGYGHGHESPDLEDSYLPVDFEDDGLPPLSEKDWEEICGDEDEDDEYDLVFGLN